MCVGKFTMARGEAGEPNQEKTVFWLSTLWEENESGVQCSDLLRQLPTEKHEGKI